MTTLKKIIYTTSKKKKKKKKKKENDFLRIFLNGFDKNITLFE